MIINIKKITSFFGKESKSRKGFTLVETLVAISILMLAVTGPLYFSSESLKAATYSRDQITAFYLAQDAFEQIRKIRDDNLSGAGSWKNGLDICGTSCLVNGDGSFYNVVPNGGDDYLHRDDNGIYSHRSGGIKTAFRRVVKIEPTGGSWDSATEMKVTVTISWMSGTISRDFTAYEFLRNLGA